MSVEERRAEIARRVFAKLDARGIKEVDLDNDVNVGPYMEAFQEVVYEDHPELKDPAQMVVVDDMITYVVFGNLSGAARTWALSQPWTEVKEQFLRERHAWAVQILGETDPALLRGIQATKKQ